ncbi:MBL fold metallo-hydrolase [Arthrobacter sp. D1-29]
MNESHTAIRDTPLQRTVSGGAVPTSRRQVEAWVERRQPPVERVAEQVWSIPVDCAEFPVAYTLAYVLVGNDGGFIIIDPGWTSAAGRADLQAGLRMAGLAENDLQGIVVTHSHADHYGLAPELADRTGSWIAGHPAEIPEDQFHREVTRIVQSNRDVMQALGVPLVDLDRVTFAPEDLKRYVPDRVVDRELLDGDLLPLAGREVRAIWTPGHTRGHLSFIDLDNCLLFTGDHVLPRISPNIGLLQEFEVEHDPVGDYLVSLERLRPWSDYEACPAHEYRFTELAQRLDELRDHTHGRSNQVAAVLAGDPGASVWEVAQRLTWSRGWDALDGSNLQAALGETNAHVRHVRLIAES